MPCKIFNNINIFVILNFVHFHLQKICYKIIIATEVLGEVQLVVKVLGQLI